MKSAAHTVTGNGDGKPSPDPSNLYESERLLAEYLLFHYGSGSDVLGWPEGPQDALDFPLRCAGVPDLSALSPQPRVLDLGCAVGRTTFELARAGGECIGIDFSQSFIAAAEEIRQRGQMTTAVAVEGSITRPFTAVRPDVDPQKIRFEVGDAQQLRSDLGSFDLVVACNLLCRLPRPAALLDRMHDLLRPGGQLLLTTPCTWLEDYTPTENWLCRDGDGTSTLDGLHYHLDPRFDLLKTLDMPFLIREHARKYQWSVALASLWQRAG